MKIIFFKINECFKFFNVFSLTKCLTFVPMTESLAMQTGSTNSLFCKVPPTVGFSINTRGKIKVLGPQKIYYQPQALPKGSNSFWYATRNAGVCKDEDLGGVWAESVVYSLEFPQKGGRIATKIGETDFAARRFAQLKYGLRLRNKKSRNLQPWFDQLQTDFPDEKERDGLVYPRFTILEKGSELDELRDRIQRESYYKALVRQDPERILLNPEQ